MFKSAQKRIAAIAACLSLAAVAETKIDPTLKITAEQRYDNEIDVEAAEDANLEGVSGFMTKLSPQVGLDVKNEQLTFTGWYAVDLLYRPDTPDFSRDTQFNQRGQVELKELLTERLQLDGSVKIWKVTDPTSLPRLGVAHTLSPILYGVADADARWQLARRVALKIGYHFEGAQIDDFVTGWHSGVAHSPFAEAWINASHVDEVGLQYRYQYFLFGADSAWSNGIIGLYHRKLGELADFNARAGVAAFTHPSGILAEGNEQWVAPSGVVPVFSIALEKRTERFDFDVVAGHDLVGASAFTAAVWGDYASLEGHWQMLKALKLFGAISYFRSGVAANVGFDPWKPLAADEQAPSLGYALDAGLEWELSRIIAVQGAYDRISQINGVGPYGSFTRNIVGVRLIVQAL